MRHVDRAPEPATFDHLVRSPGGRFLARVQRPTSREFAAHPYWRTILRDLHTAYRGICAYSCHYIPLDTGADTVEHFVPKSVDPSLAYEWSNFRLVCQTLNGRKGDARDVLDPFAVQNGWFVIAFPSLLVGPHNDLDGPRRQQVVDTCARLGLNDESTCLAGRERFVRAFCKRHISWAYLERDAPFLAHEIERQGLRETLPSIMSYGSEPDPDWPDVS